MKSFLNFSIHRFFTGVYPIYNGLRISIISNSLFIFLFIIQIFIVANHSYPQGIINLNTSNYGASPQNWSVIQDSSGIIYVANTDGILINKGSSWQVVPVGENLSALSLTLDRKGRIYCGGYADFGYLYGTMDGLVKYQSLLSLLPDSLRNFRNVWQTFALKNGDICFNALKNLFIYKEMNERNDTTSSDNNIRDLQIIYPTQKSFFKTFYAHETLWILQKGGEGIYMLEKSGSSYSVSKPLTGTEVFSDKSVFTLLPYEKNTFLGGIMGGGLFQWNNNLPSIELLPDLIIPSLTQAQIYCGATKNSNEFIIGTLQEGIYMVNPYGGLLRHINRTKNGLLGDRVNNLFSSSNEILWVSLENGLSMIPFTEPLQYFAEGNGFSGMIQCIIRFQGAEASYKIKSPSCLNKSDEMVHTVKTPLFPSFLYIGTSQGVWRSKTTAPEPGEWVRIENIKTQCFNFLVTSSGELIVAGGDGIYLIKNSQSTLATKLESAPGARCFASFDCPCAHHHAGILAAGQNGISIISEIKEPHATSKQISSPYFVIQKHVLPDEILTLIPIENSIETGVKEFWLGARSRGTWKLKLSGCPFIKNEPKESFNMEVQSIDTSSGMNKGQVQIFLVDSIPLFCHENLGVFRFNSQKNKFERDTLTQTISGKSFSDSLLLDRVVSPSPDNIWMSNGKRLYFGSKKNNLWISDTLPFMGLDIGNIRSIYPDVHEYFRNRYVWIGGDEGLALFKLTEKKNYHADYPCFLEKIVSGRDCVLFNGIFAKPISDGHDPQHFLPALNQEPEMAPVLDYEMGNLRFEYSAFFKEHEDKLRYTARLEGFEDNWREWSDRKFAEYTNLKEGNYIFHVKCRNVYLQESNEIRFHFTILPPFHRTWWFYSLQLGGIVFLFLMAGYLRRRRKGFSSRLAPAIGTVGIFTVFEYLQNLIELVAENVLGTIVLFKVALNVIMAFALIPLERLMNRVLKIEKKTDMHVKDKNALIDPEEDDLERVKREARKELMDKMKQTGMSDEEIRKISGE